MASTPTLQGFPVITQPLVDVKTGQVNTIWYKYLASLDAAVRALLTSSATALSSGGGTLTSGFQETPYQIGSVSSGSIKPQPSNGLKQQVINNGAFNIQAPTQVGDVELLITNGASPGAVTFVGFTKQFAGDPMDTTAGHQFLVFIYGLPNKATGYVVKALQ